MGAICSIVERAQPDEIYNSAQSHVAVSFEAPVQMWML